MAVKVKVEGTATVKDGASSSIKSYEAEFILDASIKDEAEARSLIQNGLINNHLKKTLDNFKRVRECQIVEFNQTDEKAKSSELDKAMLEAIKLGCVPEMVDMYTDEADKIKVIKKSIEANKKSAKKKPKDVVEDQGYVD